MNSVCAELTACWGSVLRLELQTQCTSTSWLQQGKRKNAILRLPFNAVSDHRYLEHYNQKQQQQRASWPDGRYCFIARWLHWVHTGHILALHNPVGLDLYPVLPPNSSVWSSGRGKGRGCRVRAAIVHRGLCHIHLKSSPHSLLTDTLNDGPPNNTEQISLWAQVLDDFGRPPPLPSPFQIPARKWKTYWVGGGEWAETTKDMLNFPFLPILQDRPILKLLFVQSLSLTLLMLPPFACYCLSTGCCEKATN